MTERVTTIRLVVLDKDGEDRMDYPLSRLADARECVDEYAYELPHDAPYRLVTRTITTTDEEVTRE